MGSPMPIMTSGFGQLNMCGLMVPKLDSNKPWFNMSISKNDGGPLLDRYGCCCCAAFEKGCRVIHGEEYGGSDGVDMLPTDDCVENPSDGVALLMSKSG